MRKIVMTGFLMAVAMAQPAAQRIDLVIDTAAATVTWTLPSALHTVHGTFKTKKAELWIEPATSRAGGIVIVDATSGESGNDSRDGKMHKSVLESAKFPEITFAPDRFEGKVDRSGDSSLQVMGKLNIHGAVHEVTMPVQTHVANGELTGTATVTVPYVKWGMKDPSNFLLKVKDTVAIEIQVRARLK